MKQFHDAKVFSYSKNYSSLTHETRIKDAVNVEDLKFVFWRPFVPLKWDNVLVNMDYELSFFTKSDYVQYQTIDGAAAPFCLGRGGAETIA